MSLLFDPIRASVEFGSPTTISEAWLRGDPLPGGRRTAAGEVVTDEKAMALSAFYACIRNGAQDVAKLPRQFHRRRAKRGSDIVVDHPAARILRKPNPIMRWGAFAQCTQHRLMGWGKAPAEIVRDQMGYVAEIWPIHPSRMKPRLLSDQKTVVYDWSPDGGKPQKTMDARDVFYPIGLGNGIDGYSVIQFASETIGVGLAAQRHAGAFFGEGMAKRLIAIVKGALIPEKRRELRKRIQGDRILDPVGFRKLPILEDDIQLQEAGIDPRDAQLLESREFTIEDVARWFRMPLSKIQYFKRAQGWATLDALNTDYAVDFLAPWVQAWEEELWEKVLLEEERERHFFKLDLRGLMRGDTASRIAYFNAGLLGGWLSQNDVRAIEDLPPIDDPAADEYRVQSQMVPISESSKDAEDPAPAPQPFPRPPALPPGEKPDDQVEEDGAAEDPEDASAAVRLEAEALRPMLLATAQRLVKKEVHQLGAALERHAGNAAAFDKWSRTFYAKHREEILEAFDSAAAAVAVMERRHPKALFKPPDLAAVARSHARDDLSPAEIQVAVKMTEADRAKALADAVFEELVATPKEIVDA